MHHYSQHGQDALVGDVLFKGRPGVFVDVGARDGITISNTYYLEKYLHWTGVAIEPHPELYNLLLQRRSCKCVNIAASNEDSLSVDFIKLLEEPVGNSGLLSTFRDRSWLSKIKHEIVRVQCQKLSTIITGLSVIDYIDIDVEGHEYQVIEGIDFDQVEIKTIGVEVSEKTLAAKKIDDFLETKGFFPFAQLRSDRFFKYGSNIVSTGNLF